MLVSCIMPTKNRRRFVPAAISSFLAQTHREKELLIIDNGDDRIADLVPADPSIRYVPAGPGLSLGGLRNQACEAARGTIIVHWDDDDWSAPWRLAYQVRDLTGSGSDIAGLDHVLFFDPVADVAWEYRYPRTVRPWVHGGTFCYTRQLWRARPFADVGIGEDQAFLARPGLRIRPHQRNDFFVGQVHAGNTSPKATDHAVWQRVPVAAVRALMGPDWPDDAPAAAPAPRTLPAPRATGLAMPGNAALVAVGRGLGDVLRATPLIRALHSMAYAVDVALSADHADTADLLRGAPEIRVLRTGSPQDACDAAYDVAIFTPWTAGAADAVVARTKHVVPTETWLADGDASCLERIARAIGWNRAMPAPFAHGSGRDFALPPGTIALHAGCKPDWPWKRWHGFADLAARMEHVVVVGSAADEDNAGTYFGHRHAWPPHVRRFIGTLGLADTAALIGQCAALVANDSGIMHLGVALGVPTFGVFGITSPMREAIPVPWMVPVTKALPCEPACRLGAWGRRDCEHHLGCLKQLTADDVLRAVREQLPELSGGASRPAARQSDGASRPAARQSNRVSRPAAQPGDGAARSAVRTASNVLTVAVRLEGGFGDILVAAPVVEALFHALGRPALDVYCAVPAQGQTVFRASGIARAVLALRGYVAGRYDVVATISHFVEYELRNPDRLPRQGLRLLRAAMERFEQDRGLHQRRPHTDGLAGRLAVLRGETRLSALARSSGLPVQPRGAFMPDPAAQASAVRSCDSLRGRYVTVHDGFDGALPIAPGGATKCWPLEHWAACVAGLHDAIPGLRAVQLGGVKSRHIPGVDLDLAGRTTLDEAAWIIQAAALHIDTDSGLTHLAAAVGTRAVVLFGPTDRGYFGYDMHHNIAAADCTGCWWSTPDWMTQCPRGLARPACMDSIEPEQVVRAARAMLAGGAPVTEACPDGVVAAS
jgi:ADP-heptose:LPS heptosyltransferase